MQLWDVGSTLPHPHLRRGHRSHDRRVQKCLFYLKINASVLALPLLDSQAATPVVFASAVVTVVFVAAVTVAVAVAVSMFFLLLLLVWSFFCC